MKITKAKQLNELPKSSIIIVGHAAYQNHHFKDGEAIWTNTYGGMYEPITSKKLIKYARAHSQKVLFIFEAAPDA
jgi:hypothetical protein